MARFAGPVGYGTSIETSPGVYKDVIVERVYFGDVVQGMSRNVDGEKVNKDVSVSNSISIVADEYANGNFLAIRYVKWAGVLWTVDSVELKSPRLLLRLGEVYNGITP